MSSQRSRLRHRALVCWLAAATVLSACSSTNDAPSDEPRALEATGEPSAVPSAAALVDTDGTPLTEAEIIEKVNTGELPRTALSSARPAPTRAGRAGSTGSAAAPPRRAAAGSPTVPSAGRSGPGFSATEIKIGISLFQPGSVAETFGIDAAFGDGRKQAEAVVKYINAHGGIAGRTVKPSYYTVDFGRAGSYTDGSFEAEACEQWTNDDRVFAAINDAMARPALLTCLGKAGVPGIHDGLPIDEKRLSEYRDYYYTGTGPKALTIDRTAIAVATVLGNAGFYRSAGAKPTVVGILHYDDQFYAEVVNKKMFPIIQKFGVSKVVVQAAPYGATTPDATYVARFQEEGVTNVHFLGEANTYPMTFMPAAESQGYRPKYGISTEQYPNLLESTEPIPRQQLANVDGVGWSQLLDVNNGADPGPTGPNDTLCLDIQKKAGQDMSVRGARFTATTYCHGLFFLQKSFLNDVADLTPTGLAGGVAALGTGYSSPGAFNPTSYSRTKHDGGVTYRDFVFKNGAFVYTSGNKRLPV